MLTALLAAGALLQCSTLTAASSRSAQAPRNLAVGHFGSGASQRRAAKDVRRFVYELSGSLLPVVDLLATSGGAVPAGVIVGTAGDVSSANEALDLGLPLGSASAAQRLLHAGSPGSGVHLLHSQIHDGNSPLILCLGVDNQSMLYAAYTLLEHLGVRFRIDGDVVPTGLQAQWHGRPAEMLVSAVGAGKMNGEPISPSFDDRGLLPFHDL